ncbi:MAG: SUMF1/EgtB/PvdO family nonheme iron enzyme [Phycisphaerales bacterium]
MNLRQNASLPSIARTLAVLAAAAGAGVACAEPCTGDINGDGLVGPVDLADLLAQWGGSGSPTGSADLDGDGVVGASDLANLLGAWGPCAVVPPWATLLEPAPDPNIVTDAALRAAIAATGLAWRVRDNASQVEMVLVPAGAFSMGCTPSNASACGADESPVHPVEITSAFYVGRYEVTQAQWSAVVGSNPSFFQGASYPNSAQRPVERVSWHILHTFLEPTGTRLLTEAEWEYACRAGTTSAFHGRAGAPAGTNDDTQIGAIAWYSANNGAAGTPTFGTKAVGQKAANGFGLHDMAGNVREWVVDYYASDFYFASPVQDPFGPFKGTDHVLRGGSWVDGTNLCRSSCRFYFPEVTTGSAFTGFRVARNP